MTIVSLLSHVPLCRWEEPVLLHSKANCFRCLLFLPVILGVVYLSPQHSSEDHVSTFYFHLPSVNRVRLLTKPQIQ